MRLQGAELISCAKANAKHGLASTTKVCGYGDDHEAFERDLKQACEEARIHIQSLSDLVNQEEVKVMHERKTL